MLISELAKRSGAVKADKQGYREDFPEALRIQTSFNDPQTQSGSQCNFII